MQRVPVNDLSRELGLRDEILSAMERVYKNGWFVLGEEVEAFENEFAEFCGADHCIGLANGTDALELALRSLKIEPGERVATVANAGMYSTTAILATGAVPVYVDIYEQTMLMSDEELKNVLQRDIAAVIVTHLYGRMADLPAILKITEQLNIPVIEDCAQAHGATLNSRRAGSWGRLACFSFYPTKNLGAVGDAGAIITSDDMLANRIRRLRQYGWEKKYYSTEKGGKNSRLDELQAAILRVKLPRLKGWNEQRREIANAYHVGITNPFLEKPARADDSDVCHLFVVRSSFRHSLQAHLEGRGIGTDIHYPLPDYRQPSIADMFPHAHLEHTEEACEQVLTLPCFPGMHTKEVEAVVQAIKSWRPK